MKIQKQLYKHYLDNNPLYGYIFETPDGSRFEIVSLDSTLNSTIIDEANKNIPGSRYVYRAAATPRAVEQWLAENPQYIHRISKESINLK